MRPGDKVLWTEPDEPVEVTIVGLAWPLAHVQDEAGKDYFGVHQEALRDPRREVLARLATGELHAPGCRVPFYDCEYTCYTNWARDLLGVKNWEEADALYEKEFAK